MIIKIPKYIKIIFYIISTITIILVIGSIDKWLSNLVFFLCIFYLIMQIDNDRCSHCSNYIDEKKIYNKFSGKCESCFMEHYHKNHKIKDDLNIKCRCDIPTCDDCISKNCKDRDCPIHTNILKIKAIHLILDNLYEKEFPNITSLSYEERLPLIDKIQEKMTKYDYTGIKIITMYEEVLAKHGNHFKKSYMLEKNKIVLDYKLNYMINNINKIQFPYVTSLEPEKIVELTDNMSKEYPEIKITQKLIILEKKLKKEDGITQLMKKMMEKYNLTMEEVKKAAQMYQSVPYHKKEQFPTKRETTEEMLESRVQSYKEMKEDRE